MIAALIIFVICYALIVTERMDRTAAALLGASAVVIFGLVPYEEVLRRVDLNVVFLLAGMMIVVNVLSHTGLFEWIAVVIAQTARGNGVLILAGLLIATALLSALLDNVTTVVLIAPITILLTQILEVRAAPFLVLEAIFSNIGGAATLVGDPPNILIGSQTHLGFNDFVVHLAPVVLICMVAALAIILPLYRGSMRVSPAARARIMRAQPRLAITDPVRLRRGLIVFAGILAGFVFSHALGVEPGIVALAGGVTMILVCRLDVRETLEKVEWDSIFFLIGLFMLVGALDYHGLFDELGQRLFAGAEGSLPLALLAVLWGSAIASALVGAIPVTMAMIPLLHAMMPAIAATMGMSGEAELFTRHVAEPLWWALALGACLGGNGSIIGAAANVVVVQIAQRNHCRVSFAAFSLYGAPIMVLTLVIASAYLLFRYVYLSPL